MMLAKKTASVRPAARAAGRSRVVKVQAKYGEGGKFVDLQDMSNTTGAWDLYGQDSDRRYPALQAEFFDRAGAALSRRESLLGFVALSGIGAIAAWGAKGSKDANLPITKGPQTSGENGKGGSVRGRL